jgi:hypothetical protein
MTGSDAAHLAGCDAVECFEVARVGAGDIWQLRS